MRLPICSRGGAARSLLVALAIAAIPAAAEGQDNLVYKTYKITGTSRQTAFNVSIRPPGRTHQIFWRSGLDAAGMACTLSSRLNQLFPEVEVTCRQLDGRFTICSPTDFQLLIQTNAPGRAMVPVGTTPVPFNPTIEQVGEYAGIGRGCPGTGGCVPDAVVEGMPAIGNGDFALTVTDGLASAPALLLFSDAAGFLPLGGCTVYTALPALSVILLTDASGTATAPLPLPPDPALVGATFYGQFAISDPNGALFGAASMSQGVAFRLMP